MIIPAFKKENVRTQNKKSEDIIITAANSLASRFDKKAGCIRSCDDFHGMRPSSHEDDLIVIIDNMCNLNLLYIGAYLSRVTLSTIATTHAKTTLRKYFRKDWSSYHVVVYGREPGEPASKSTGQGYADESS